MASTGVVQKLERQILERHTELSKVDYSPQSDAGLTKVKILLVLEAGLLMACDVEWAPPSTNDELNYNRGGAAVALDAREGQLRVAALSPRNAGDDAEESAEDVEAIAPGDIEAISPADSSSAAAAPAAPDASAAPAPGADHASAAPATEADHASAAPGPGADHASAAPAPGAENNEIQCK